MTKTVKPVVNVVVVNLIGGSRDANSNDKPASAGKIERYVSALAPYWPFIVKLLIRVFIIHLLGDDAGIDT